VATNKHGLDNHYFATKLHCVYRDLEKYTPKELARELVRLAYTADEDACVFETQRLDIEKGQCT